MTESFEQFFRRLPKETQRGLAAGVRLSASLISREAQNLMRNSTPTGRQYGKHKASAPGEPPAPDRGAGGGLLGSFSEEFEIERNKVQGVITVNSDHAAPLEFGTARIAARPFMRPTLEAKKKAALKLQAKAWERHLATLGKKGRS